MILEKRFLGNLFIFLVLLLVLTSCIRNQSWTYYYPRHSIERPPLQKKIITVFPFSDHRGNTVVESFLKCFLPLVVSCPTLHSNQRPETLSKHAFSGAWTFHPTEDIAKGFSVELRSHNIFKKVFYATTKIPADLELHGILHSTAYEHKMMLYGLSFFGYGAAAILGAPTQTIRNHLAFEIFVLDQASGKTIWKNSYEGDFINYHAWWRLRPLDFAYDKLLGEMMPAILADLEYAMSVTAF